jgi:nucleoside-diphosphate-sugar epimerase
MLLERDLKVRVLDSLLFGGEGLLAHFANPDFECVVGDVRNPDDVGRAVKDCDVIIHLAAIVGFPACRRYPQLARETNVDGTKVLADAVGPDRLVLFASTGSNYGALAEEICTEETPLRPVSLYGESKTEAERHLMNTCNTIGFRFATAFGISPRMRLDLLINDFVYQAVKAHSLVVYERHFMRTFIHVRDIARAFLFGIDRAAKMAGQVYNVGSEKMNYSKEAVCRLIQERVEFYLHFADVGRDLDARNYYVSYDKISALGYQTTLDVQDGIDELIRGLPVLRVSNPYSNA